MTKTAHLAQIVAQHDAFFDNLAQTTPSPAVKLWILSTWYPWRDHFNEIMADGGELGADLLQHVSHSLAALRAEATAEHVAIPDLEAAAPGVAHASDRANAQVEADINRKTNEWFWQDTGYKPGQKLDPHDPQDAKMIPIWVSMRYQIALATARHADPHQPVVTQEGAEHIHASQPYASGWFDNLENAVSTKAPSLREIATHAVFEQLDPNVDFYVFYLFSMPLQPARSGVATFQDGDQAHAYMRELKTRRGLAYAALFKLGGGGPDLIDEEIPSMFKPSHTSVSGGNCGARSFSGITPEVLNHIMAHLHERGADVTGANPWMVDTHDHGVVLRGRWDAQAGVLTLEITDSDTFAPCAAVWSALDDMLTEVGATPIATTIVGRRGGGGGGRGGGGMSRHGAGRGWARFPSGRYVYGGGGWGGDSWGEGGPWYGGDVLVVDDDDDVPEDGQLVAIAPVISAGMRGVEVKLAFHPSTKLLDASICIDGRVYRARADLSWVIDEIGSAIANYHHQLHGDPQAPAAIAAVQGEVNQAIRTAGEALVGATIDQHQREICAGWWHDLTSSVKKAVHGVEHAASAAAGTVGHTLVALKGPIATAAGLAAGAAALGIPGVGPIIAPMAGKLANDLVNAAAGSGSVAAAAQNAVASAQQAAQSNPQVAQALDIAHQAVAKSTIAHHLAQTVANAASGNASAQQQIQDLAKSAAQGDPAAQEMTSLASDISNVVSDNATDDVVSGRGGGGGGGGRGFDHNRDRGLMYDNGDDVAVQGAFLPFALGFAGGAAATHYGPKLWEAYKAQHPTTVSGAATAALSEIAARTAAAEHLKGARVVGVAIGAPGNPLAQSVQAFHSTDDADDWFGQIASQPSAYGYVAYYDAADPTWPAPINEAHGHATGSATAQVSGLLPLLLAGGAGAVAGAYFWPAVKAKIDAMFPKKAVA